MAASRAAETAQPEPLIRDEFAFLLVAAAGPARAQLAGSEPHWIGDNPEAHRIHVMARNYQAVRTPLLRRLLHRGHPTTASARSSSSPPVWTRGRSGWTGLPEPRCTRSTSPRCWNTRPRHWGRTGPSPAHNMSRCRIDLREDWPAALIEAGFDPEQPTAWLAEGLLPYLPGEAQDRLFELVGAHSAPGSRLAVEDFTMDPARYTPEKRAARRAVTSTCACLVGAR